MTFAVASDGGGSDDPTFSTASLKLYTDAAGGTRRYFPIYTAIVQMVDGIVKSVTFDEGCFFCDSASPQCVTNALPVTGGAPVADTHQQGCFMTTAECTPVARPDNPNANSCDLKIFVVWTGTDASGNYLMSAGKRFSRFRQYSLGLSTVWDDIKTTAANAVNRAIPGEPAR